MSFLKQNTLVIHTIIQLLCIRVYVVSQTKYISDTYDDTVVIDTWTCRFTNKIHWWYIRYYSCYVYVYMSFLKQNTPVIHTIIQLLCIRVYVVSQTKYIGDTYDDTAVMYTCICRFSNKVHWWYIRWYRCYVYVYMSFLKQNTLVIHYTMVKRLCIRVYVGFSNILC